MSLVAVTLSAQAPTAAPAGAPQRASEPAVASYVSQRLNGKPLPVTDRVTDDKGVQYLIEFDELILTLRPKHEFRAALKYRQTLAAKGERIGQDPLQKMTVYGTWSVVGTELRFVPDPKRGGEGLRILTGTFSGSRDRRAVRLPQWLGHAARGSDAGAGRQHLLDGRRQTADGDGQMTGSGQRMADRGRRKAVGLWCSWRLAVARAAVLLVSSVQALAAQAGPADAHFALVRARFDSSRAMRTVVYLDRFVRWPGNAGFDSSIMYVAARLAAAGFVERSSAEVPTG